MSFNERGAISRYLFHKMKSQRAFETLTGAINPLKTIIKNSFMYRVKRPLNFAFPEGWATVFFAEKVDIDLDLPFKYPSSGRTAK